VELDNRKVYKSMKNGLLMMSSTYTFKKDEYSKARNSYSRIINVLCRKCKQVVLVYQKDGPGNLRRLYFDRIYDPKALTHLEKNKINEVSTLKCKCGVILGTPYIYTKENRKAF